MQQPSDGKRFKLGHYGAGTLWCHSTREATFRSVDLSAYLTLMK
jgi:hypothetical protein